MMGDVLLFIITVIGAGLFVGIIGTAITFGLFLLMEFFDD